MSTQPEALILAEIMDAKGSRQRNELGDYWDDSWCNKAATELRRLHEVNTDLLEALKKVVEHIQWREEIQGCLGTFEEVLPEAVAAIAKATGA
jgi:hypothetical protein